MQLSTAGLKLIQSHEGLRLDAYRCPAGVWTIGYGTTRMHGRAVRQGDRITAEEALDLLRDDVSRFEPAVRRLVAVPLNQHQFDALVSFAYNVGENALAESTLLRKLNAGDYEGAAAEFGRWVHGGGQRLPGLVRRRAEERELFLTPAESPAPNHWLNEVETGKVR